VDFDPSDWQDLSQLLRYRQQEEANRLLRLQVLNQQRIAQGLPPLANLPKSKSEIAWDNFWSTVFGFIGLCGLVFICWLCFLFLQNYFKTKQQVRDLLKSAESGVVDSQYRLALAYKEGNTQGIEQNSLLAEHWLTKASDGGHSRSTMQLADSQLSAGNFSAAYTRYELAAQQGDASAQIKIGEAYLNGKHFSQDIEKAEVWFRRAMLDPIAKYKAERLLKDLDQTKGSLLAQRKSEVLKTVLSGFSSLQENLNIFVRGLETQKTIDLPSRVLLRDAPYLQPKLFSTTSFSIVGNEVFIQKANTAGGPSIYSKRLYSGSYSVASSDSYLLPFKFIDGQMKDILSLQRNFPDLASEMEEDYKRWLAAAKKRLDYLNDILDKIDQVKQGLANAFEKITREIPAEVKNNDTFIKKCASINADLSGLLQIKQRIEQERDYLKDFL